ncbi:MAG: DUF2892 domain-containing protein [Caldimonas sp.]
MDDIELMSREAIGLASNVISRMKIRQASVPIEPRTHSVPPTRPTGCILEFAAVAGAAHREFIQSIRAHDRSYLMSTNRGLYMVPTNRWYIERTVWLVAGCVLLTATALAALGNPLWVLAVAATGAASILVALTGFCIVGNALAHLGFVPALARPDWKPGDLYFLQTDRWYLERRIYLAVGINLIVASVLSLVHSAWWLVFTGFVGAAMVWFAATGFCIMANGLYWLGAEPRLSPGRAQPATPAQQGTGHASA